MSDNEYSGSGPWPAQHRVRSHTSAGEQGELARGGDTSSAAPLPPALEERLASLYDGLKEVLSEYRPQALALEEVYSNYAYPATAVIMGHARGVICLAAAHSDCPYSATLPPGSSSAWPEVEGPPKPRCRGRSRRAWGCPNHQSPMTCPMLWPLAICHWQAAAGTEMTLKALASARKR